MRRVASETREEARTVRMRLWTAVALLAIASRGGADERPSFASLVDRLRPAVVNVQVEQGRRHDGGDGIDDFFNRFFGEGGEHRRSLGSGFLFDRSGYVITNYHVVEDADDVRVRLADDREFQGDVVGRDQKTDLALVKLRGAHDLPTVALGDSDHLHVGDWVVAIGNPFGLGNTVTAGIVSAKERVVGAGPYDDFIQTDASINPGNSGGPLFNLAGEVIGVNTAIVAGGHGIGFAIPINMVRNVADQLRRRGRVTRGYIGVGVQEVTSDLARLFRLPRPEGALISSVETGGPAARAGVRAGDVIIEWQGHAVTQSSRLPLMVAETPPGERRRFVALRDGRRVEGEMAVTLLREAEGESVAEERAPAAHHELGVKLRTLPDGEASAHNMPVGGAMVAEVAPEGRAAGLLSTGDLIVEIDRTPVHDADEARRRMSAATELLLLRVYRKDSMVFVALPPR